MWISVFILNYVMIVHANIVKQIQNMIYKYIPIEEIETHNIGFYAGNCLVQTRG